MKKLNEIVKRIDSNMFLYITFSIISILYLISKFIDSGYRKLYMLLAFTTLVVLLLGIYYVLSKFYKKKVGIERIFLFLSMIFGVFYIFGFPPSQLPDDNPDYLRSLEVSKFQLTTPQKGKKVGRSLSSNISKVYESENYSAVKKTSNLKLNSTRRFYTYANKSLYAFVCYIPQALGVGIGRILNLSILAQILLGKLFNYIFYVLLIYLSLKYIPIKKELVFFISLLPMSLQEAASLSPDAMIISTSIALTSFIVYQRKEKNTSMNYRNMILLGALSVIISLCKIVYLPLIFLIFLIPTDKFKSIKQKRIFCISICLISIILNLYWLSLSSKYLSAFHYRSNSSMQLKYIISNPIRYCIILYKTFDYYAVIYLKEMVGESLGKFVVPTSSVMVLISIILLFILILGKKKTGKQFFNVPEKIYVSILLLGTLILMFTSLYLQWTGYKENMVDGVQGRYFIPLLLVFSLLFSKEKELNYDKKLVYTMQVIDIMSIIAIITTFI